MTGPTLAYEKRPTCGSVSVHRDGPTVHVVAGPEPLGWRTVVGWTLAVGVAGGALVMAAMVPHSAVAFVVVLLVGRWTLMTWNRHRRGRRGGPVATQFIASPDGLTWIRSGWPEPWQCAAAHVAAVKLHLSPPSQRRTHPVTVVLVLTNGDRHDLGHGSLAEAELIAESIEEGLGLHCSGNLPEGTASNPVDPKEHSPCTDALPPPP